MYDVEVADGRMEPVPEYFGDWQIARWMGVTKSALREMPIYEIDEARIVMAALNDAERQMAGKSAK